MLQKMATLCISAFMSNKTYLLGCSGGSDSMALFALLKENKINFEVAHVNYHLREEADKESEILEDYCQKEKIIFHRLNASITKGNAEEEARNIRYDYYAYLATLKEYEAVLVAHHRGDYLETYLMQKRRGTTPEYYGLKEVTYIKGIKVIRPLLNYYKEDLMEYCDREKIPYSIDKSNFDEKYTRNKIRKELLNFSKEAKEKLYEASLKDNSLRQEEIRATLALIQGKTKWDISEFKAFPYKREFLRRILYLDLADKQLDDLIHKLLNSKSFNELIRNKYLVKEYGYISSFDKIKPFYLELEELKYQDYGPFKITQEGNERELLVVNDKDFPLIIRSSHNGDRIQMSFGKKKLSRYFIDHKVALSKRLKTIVVENQFHEIIFVSGIGKSHSHLATKAYYFVLKCDNTEA